MTMTEPNGGIHVIATDPNSPLEHERRPKALVTSEHDEVCEWDGTPIPAGVEHILAAPVPERFCSDGCFRLDTATCWDDGR